MTDYTTRETVTTTEMWGMTTERTRWMTAEELMATREPDIDWRRVSRLYDITSPEFLDDGQVKLNFLKKNRAYVIEHLDEIKASKDSFRKLHDAKREIASARHDADRKRESAFAAWDAPMDGWENGYGDAEAARK